MRVAVVGGGVVGLACAYSLAREGADVIVVERDRCGEAASRGNTGWVVPGLSAPLPAPGVVGGALKGILARDSPLKIKPTVDPKFLRWSWRFWRSCSPDQYVRGLRATVELGERSFELYDAMRSAGVPFDLHRGGMVAAGISEAGVVEYRAMVDGAREQGYAGGCEPLDGDEIRRIEPSLSNAVVGGVYAESERYLRPEELTSGLVAHLRSSGARVLEQTIVKRLSQTRGGAWHVEIPTDTLSVDAVVVAAGVWSRRLLAQLGKDILLEAAKGYSITAEGEGTLPRHALYLCEAKVGCSTYDDQLRIAGIFDLTGIDTSLGERRIESMVRTSLPFLESWRPRKVTMRWAGLRPYPPDGLPIIGPVPGLDGLVVATGHGRMGITLAPPTGEAVASIVLGRTRPPGLEAFSVDRVLAAGR